MSQFLHTSFLSLINKCLERNQWKQVLASFMAISHISKFEKDGVCQLHFEKNDFKRDILPNSDDYTLYSDDEELD